MKTEARLRVKLWRVKGGETMKKMLGKKVQGFPLIELIIVIAILGILAVAVLSAINPLEQIRKANDARRRSNAAELLNALERYTATYAGAYPTGFTFDTAQPGALLTSSDVALLGNELKSEFGTRISKSTDLLYVYSDTNSLAHVCYQIESEEQAAKYSSTLYSGADGDYICLPE